MKVNIILFISILLLFTSCKKTLVQKSKNKKPNFIFIVMDDLDFDEVNFYMTQKYPCYYSAARAGIESAKNVSHKTVKLYMPNLDKLAEKSAIFTHFYANSSVCTPVRYALLTGRNAWESPFIDKETPENQPAFIKWNSFISPDEETIIKPLHERGYKAAIIGKWHNGANGRNIRIPMSKDELMNPETAELIKNDYDYFIHFLKDSIGFDHADRIFYDNPFILNLEWITEGVNQFIESYRDEPFFLYLPLPFPHAQYYDYKDFDPLATPTGMLTKVPESGHSYKNARTKNKLHTLNDNFSMATWIDDFIGEIFKQLEKYGLDQNTMIVFTSDQQTQGKFTCYETLRIPTFIYYPPLISKKQYVDELCMITDLIPTMFEIIDGKALNNNPYKGISLVPLLQSNSKTQWRKEIFTEISYCKALVTEKYKYIAARPPQFVWKAMQADSSAAKIEKRPRRVGWDGQNWNWKGVVYDADRDFPCYFDKDQLYDLENDIFEQKNLAYLPEYQDVLADMKERLKIQMADYPFNFGEFSTEKRK